MSDIQPKTEAKVGARHSGSDQAALQAVHDNAVALGALCPLPVDAEKTLISFGTEVKALGNGKVGGYLVRFSDAASPDLTDDYFDAFSDLGGATQSDTYYHHGLDLKIGKRVLGLATLKRDDAGVWAETQLAMRDEYEKAIYAMAEKGKLGWSSGTASHLVEREQVGKVHHILRWPLGLDASLTPTPAEPRNSVQTLKSYIGGLPGQAALDSAPAATSSAVPIKESNMTDEELKALRDEQAANTKAMGELLKQNAELLTELKKPALRTEPAQVAIDDSKPFKSFGEQLQAIKAAAYNPQAVDPRLLLLNTKHASAIKATGASESVGSDGGFLVQQEFSNESLNRVYNTGEILKRVSRRAIGPGANGIVINTLSETSRATGSRSGGVRSYWLNEGGTKTASRPAFRRFTLNLEKLASLFYATDELLQDATGLQGEVTTAFENEIKFMVEDAIINGDGSGKPLGILAALPVVSVSKETGQAAATITYNNVVGMYARLWPGSESKAVFLANKAIFPALMTMYLPTGISALPAPGITFTDGTFRIFGVPVIFVEYMAALGTVGDLLLVDLSEYRLIDKGGIQPDSSIHVAFLTDETAFRWVYRVNGAPFWENVVTPYKGSQTLAPFVSLATRA